MAARVKVPGWVLLVPVAAVVGCVALMPRERLTPEQEAARARADHLLGAMIRCQNETREALADGDGFEVEPYGDWRATVNGSEDDLTLAYRVRARNAVGALVWAEMVCRVRHDGTAWTAEVAQL